jgi:hypothetical protein
MESRILVCLDDETPAAYLMARTAEYTIRFWRRVDFFANVRVVDRFPFGEIFLRTPCAEVMAAPGEVAMSATRVHVGLMMESRFPIRNVTAQYLRL